MTLFNGCTFYTQFLLEDSPAFYYRNYCISRKALTECELSVLDDYIDEYLRQMRYYMRYKYCKKVSLVTRLRVLPSAASRERVHDVAMLYANAFFPSTIKLKHLSKKDGSHYLKKHEDEITSYLEVCAKKRRMVFSTFFFLPLNILNLNFFDRLMFPEVKSLY